jgi:hypothetical protein
VREPESQGWSVAFYPAQRPSNRGLRGSVDSIKHDTDWLFGGFFGDSPFGNYIAGTRAIAASRAPPWLPSDGDVGVGVFLGLPGVVVDKNARGERQTIQAAEVDLADRSFPACS